MAKIKLFLSWAHDDADLKEEFCKLLKPRLSIAKNHTITWWEDSLILPGDRWANEIQAQLVESDYILQLISPSFLASTFITNNEIPGVGNTPHKRILPVMLVDVPLNQSTEFHQLGDYQIYYGIDSRPCSFVSCETLYQKIKFVDGFVEQLLTRISGMTGYH